MIEEKNLNTTYYILNIVDFSFWHLLLNFTKDADLRLVMIQNKSIQLIKLQF